MNNSLKSYKTKKKNENLINSQMANTIKESSLAYSNKIINDSWDYKNANTKEFTHCFHTYPAMMIPQVARRILENYGKGAKLLFDPFCGTGTSLVEANLTRINAIGTDINPLARLIAKAKTTRINIQTLDLYLDNFSEYLFKLNFQQNNYDKVIIPKIKNLDFWFSKSVQHQLGLILHYIEGINDAKIRNFFKVAFSETVRESSFIKPGEFKLVRAKNFENKNNIDVFSLITSKLRRNRKGLIDYQTVCPNNIQTSIYDFNTVENIPSEILKPSSVDIVLTSPPYGDSKTTVAYGQYSRLANEWLGFTEANQIDNKLLGGKRKSLLKVFNSNTLNDIIKTLEQQDKQRSLDVISFYIDYEKSIINISSIIKEKGFVCYVVGNRTVKGVTIPTDEITVEFFQKQGFALVETIVRNIPNKRMPLKNSPSNIAGETAPTMKNEYIVICQKIR